MSIHTFDSLSRAGWLEIGDGYRAKNAELGGNGPIFLRSAYLQNNGFTLIDPDRFISQQTQYFGPKVSRTGDVVITTKGNSTGRIGRIRAAEAGAVYSPHLSYWRSRSREHIDQAFLYYWAASEEFRRQLAGMAHGTDMAPYLSLRDQARIRISLPDIARQIEIGSILAGLDDKIELNRRMNETLEASARALFRDWFVDFGPTRAKAEGRPAWLAPDLWSLFPDRLGDDGVPEGWIWSQLGDHVTNLDSKRVPVSGAERAKRQGRYPYHGATSVMDHVDGYLFDGIYVLVGEDGSVMRDNGLAFTQYVFGKIWVNNHAHVLQGRGATSTEQILLFFNHEQVRPFITGAVQLKLSQGRMNAMPFVDSGSEVSEAFGRAVAPLYARVRQNIIESRTLAETRDALLPKLMSGELRVRDAEALAA